MGPLDVLLGPVCVNFEAHRFDHLEIFREERDGISTERRYQRILEGVQHEYSMLDTIQASGASLGLVSSFPRCGADGVIDLAWPVFDLIKALVCERYGIIKRWLDLPAAEVLTASLNGRDSSLLLGWMLEQSFPARAALVWLDNAQQARSVHAAESHRMSS